MTRGPLPKRSSERTRRNSAGEDGIELKKGVALPYEWRDPDPEWHPWTVDFYESFRETGMSAYYQNTDVAALQLACRLLDREVVQKGRPSAMFMAETMKMLDGLGVTEGERRRMKIELEIAQEGEGDAMGEKVASLQDRLKKKKAG